MSLREGGNPRLDELKVGFLRHADRARPKNKLPVHTG